MDLNLDALNLGWVGVSHVQIRLDNGQILLIDGSGKVTDITHLMRADTYENRRSS